MVQQATVVQTHSLLVHKVYWKHSDSLFHFLRPQVAQGRRTKYRGGKGRERTLGRLIYIFICSKAAESKKTNSKKQQQTNI